MMNGQHGVSPKLPWRSCQRRNGKSRRPSADETYIYPGDIDITIYPDKYNVTKAGVFPMVDSPRPHFTAFMGPQRLAAGPLAKVAIAVMQASQKAAAPPIIIFNDATGQPIDLDLRGTEHDVVARLPQPAPPPDA